MLRGKPKVCRSKEAVWVTRGGEALGEEVLDPGPHLEGGGQELQGQEVCLAFGLDNAPAGAFAVHEMDMGGQGGVRKEGVDSLLQSGWAAAVQHLQGPGPQAAEGPPSGLEVVQQEVGYFVGQGEAQLLGAVGAVEQHPPAAAGGQQAAVEGGGPLRYPAGKRCLWRLARPPHRVSTGGGV